MEETIAAISTAPGTAGIGIIRMSGKDVFSVLKKIFKPIKEESIEEIKGYTMKYGKIFNPETNEIVDEVLVSYFKEPKSYTQENMCEINSHGGTIVVRKILELCLKNGAQMAEPGEFTKRAFLNGRIDLAKAEAVINLINAKSEKETKASINQLEGNLSLEIKKIKKMILSLLADIEASIDYPEYDEAEEVSNNKALTKLDEIQKELEKLNKSFETGKIIKDGIKVAIIGKPNSGKSSLLNAILKEDRAIVTDIEGTTRDTIEEFVTIDGIPFKFVDTAGIRQEERITKSGKDVIKISLLSNCDLSGFYKELNMLFELNKINPDNEIIITEMRHKKLIEDAISHTENAKKTILDNIPIDIISINIKEIIEDLSKITGENVTEDVINEIFSKFCLGK